MSRRAVAEKKVRTFAEAKATAEARIVELDAKVAPLESFEDPADAKKLLDARAAVEAAKGERDLFAGRLAEAQKAHSEAIAEEEKLATEERHARLRKEAVTVGEDIVKALVNFGKLATKNAEIVKELPRIECYRYFLGTYYEAASRQLVKDTDTSRQGATLQLDVRLLVPNP